MPNLQLYDCVAFSKKLTFKTLFYMKSGFKQPSRWTKSDVDFFAFETGSTQCKIVVNPLSYMEWVLQKYEMNISQEGNIKKCSGWTGWPLFVNKPWARPYSCSRSKIYKIFKSSYREQTESKKTRRYLNYSHKHYISRLCSTFLVIRSILDIETSCAPPCPLFLHSFLDWCLVGL